MHGEGELAVLLITGLGNEGGIRFTIITVFVKVTVTHILDFWMQLSMLKF